MKVQFGSQNLWKIVKNGYEGVRWLISVNQKFENHVEQCEKDELQFLFYGGFNEGTLEKISHVKTSKQVCEILWKSFQGIPNKKFVHLIPNTWVWDTKNEIR